MKALWALDVKKNQFCHGCHVLEVLNHYFPLVGLCISVKVVIRLGSKKVTPRDGPYESLKGELKLTKRWGHGYGCAINEVLSPF
jgi:hypothetical protein